LHGRVGRQRLHDVLVTGLRDVVGIAAENKFHAVPLTERDHTPQAGQFRVDRIVFFWRGGTKTIAFGGNDRQRLAPRLEYGWGPAINRLLRDFLEPRIFLGLFVFGFFSAWSTWPGFLGGLGSLRMRYDNFFAFGAANDACRHAGRGWHRRRRH